MREADDLDSAATLTQRRTDDAIKAAAHSMRPQQVRNPDGSWPITECEGCGDAIPEGRLLMARIRCVYCQERFERGLSI